MGRTKDNGFAQFIREGIRDTVRETLKSVVHEATEQELRAALREKDVRTAILELIRQELREAMQGLRVKPKPRSRTPGRVSRGLVSSSEPSRTTR